MSTQYQVTLQRFLSAVTRHLLPENSVQLNDEQLLVPRNDEVAMQLVVAPLSRVVKASLSVDVTIGMHFYAVDSLDAELSREMGLAVANWVSRESTIVYYTRLRDLDSQSAAGCMEIPVSEREIDDLATDFVARLRSQVFPKLELVNSVEKAVEEIMTNATTAWVTDWDRYLPTMLLSIRRGIEAVELAREALHGAVAQGASVDFIDAQQKYVAAISSRIKN